MPITAEYDKEADALYVRLREGARVRAVEIDDLTIADVASDHRPVGLEFLNASQGLELQEAARRFALEQQLPEIVRAIIDSGAPVEPPTLTGGQLLASTSITTVVIEGTVPAATAPLSDTASKADRRLIIA